MGGMAKDKTVKDPNKSEKPSSKQGCEDEFGTKPELDGKNDSGPDPEVHGKELPPQ